MILIIVDFSIFTKEHVAMKPPNLLMIVQPLMDSLINVCKKIVVGFIISMKILVWKKLLFGNLIVQIIMDLKINVMLILPISVDLTLKVMNVWPPPVVIVLTAMNVIITLVNVETL